MPKVYVVGVGNDGAAGLGREALDLIHRADLLCGSRRLLDSFPEVRAQKTVINSNHRQLTDLIGESLTARRTVVLASGDPNFYGIAKHLVGVLGKDVVEIIPNVSSIQLAFARIKESWEDAALTSVHGRSIEEIIDLVRSSRKTGILTDGQRTPGEIARVMLAHGLNGYRAFVCENLGSPAEKVIEADLPQLANLPVSTLNVLILLKEQDQRPRENPVNREGCSLGIPDHEFFQRKPLRGLITKAEVRAVSLSKMRLREESVVWDVGAGSGSISVEAALVARRGRVYAVERRPADAALVKENFRKFGVGNALLVEGQAPEALVSLPDPDAVFVGGSGGAMKEIIELACRRVKPNGRVVANIATIANLDSTVRHLMAWGFDVDVTLVNIARSKLTGGLLRFEALDPVFVVSAERREGAG